MQEKAKAQLIVYLLTSILTHYCNKFAFLNRMGFESAMPMHGGVNNKNPPKFGGFANMSDLNCLDLRAFLRCNAGKDFKKTSSDTDTSA